MLTLQQFIGTLQGLDQLRFRLPGGIAVPDHFHITEVGLVTKDFVDCGGVRRTQRAVTFQLWTATDYDHRLSPSKLLSIIDVAQKTLDIQPDDQVQVEYQGITIGVYTLRQGDGVFYLTPIRTACLAPDQCGIPASGCTPGSGCC